MAYTWRCACNIAITDMTNLDLLCYLHNAENVEVIGNIYDNWHECSLCGAISQDRENYCPNCGAKMDGGKDEGGATPDE